MDDNFPLRGALERWQVARDALAHFEALHLTLLLVSRESQYPIRPPTLPDGALDAWRAAEAEAHATYADLLSLLAQAPVPETVIERTH